ncbi:hypothetical protein [Sphingobium sp.]|uniref:hypothetical protein n=1 Tax=Sphingobium sp. TaxID=1912891 RepID=UPI003BEEB7A0
MTTGLVQQPVQQRGRDDGIAEDLSLFGKAAIGGEDHGALFIACVDELEEEVGAVWGDRQVSDLVDDEQRCPGEEADLLPQRAFAFGFGKLSDQIRAREAEEDALKRIRQQLQSFLLAHGGIYAGPKSWTWAHIRWLARLSFGHPAHQIVLAEYS